MRGASIHWLLGVCLLIAACAPAQPVPGPAQPGAPAEPQERRAAQQVLRIGRPGFPISASPESSSANNQIFGNQFDTLTSVGKGYQLQPAVATRWEFLPNDNGWRFFLRRDLTFSNGEKLTAADVEFTARMLLEVSPPLPQRGLLPKLADVRLVDEYTVDLLTAGRDSSLLYGTPYLFILPKNYYQSVGKDGFALKPIGSGPYELVEFKTADVFRYRLRPNYTHPYRKPIATEVIWRAIPESTALVNGLRLGELDIIWTGLSPDQAEAAKREGNTVVLGEPSSALIAIDKAASEKYTPALLDRRVRLALNYAVDRETLAKNLYRGYAQPLNQVAIPGTPAYNPDIPPFRYDVAEAKRLLAEAGYPNGFKVQNPLDYTLGFGVLDALFLAVQDSWKQIGVEVGLQRNEVGIWVDKFYARNNQVRNELISSGGSDPVGILLFFRQFITCNNPPARIIWCVPEFDRLMDLAYAEPDAAKREQLVREAIKAHQAEISYVYLLAVPQIFVAGPKVRGFTVDTATFWTSDNVYKVE
ncbi:MAG: diguanylate phosphodiesterase [Dehalococcoidia bacterium]|nr:MAG: diguanylate phosphodiesterase [Dehalococcoidia bacterium]